MKGRKEAPARARFLCLYTRQCGQLGPDWRDKRGSTGDRELRWMYIGLGNLSQLCNPKRTWEPHRDVTRQDAEETESRSRPKQEFGSRNTPGDPGRKRLSSDQSSELHEHPE